MITISIWYDIYIYNIDYFLTLFISVYCLRLYPCNLSKLCPVNTRICLLLHNRHKTSGVVKIRAINRLKPDLLRRMVISASFRSVKFCPIPLREWHNIINWVYSIIDLRKNGLLYWWDYNVGFHFRYIICILYLNYLKRNQTVTVLDKP